jgi:hypothetical protein
MRKLVMPSFLSTARLPRLVTLAFLFVCHPYAAFAERVLMNPSDDTICLLYYHIANQPPPISQFAETAPSVINANEFDRPKALSDEIKSLTALYNSLATVTTIKININMSVGIYNSQFGEYDLSGFAGNEYINYNCFNNTATLQLQFDNSDYAESWALSPSQAQNVLNLNGGNRDVVAVSTISLTGVNPGAPGDPLVLIGDVKEVRVIGEYNEAPLGGYIVKSQ